MTRVLGIGLTEAWWSVLAEPVIVEAIVFTIWQAALSTAVCLILAIPSAYVLYRRNLRGGHFLRALITVPFALPTIVTAIGFSAFRRNELVQSSTAFFEFFGDPVFWIITAHVFVNYAVAVRIIGSVWATFDNETEEAASLAGAGRVRTFFSISLPQLRGAIVASAATIFLYCSTSYGLILTLGGGAINSIETEIAIAATQYLDFEEAAALALLQTLLSIVAFSISGRSHGLGLDIQDFSRHRPRLDRRDWPMLAITLFTLVTLVMLPMARIFEGAFTDAFGKATLANFANLGGRGTRDLLNITLADAALNSIRNLIVATALALVVGLTVAHILTRPARTVAARIRQRVLDIIFLLPLGVSTIVLGFGYLLTFGSGWLPLRSSWVVVPLIQGLMAIPLVVRILLPALAAANRELREAADTDGASAWQSFKFIELSLAAPSIRAAVAFAAIVSLGEFGAASLLAYGSQATLPTVMFALISRPGGDNYGMAMACSALLVVITFAVVFTTGIRRPEKENLVLRNW
jgi:thiamine transport system permease protein